MVLTSVTGLQMIFFRAQNPTMAWCQEQTDPMQKTNAIPGMYRASMKALQLSSTEEQKCRIFEKSAWILTGTATLRTQENQAKLCKNKKAVEPSLRWFNLWFVKISVTFSCTTIASKLWRGNGHMATVTLIWKMWVVSQNYMIHFNKL